jgi:NDP-sugar pyrophosphorylase family protein
MRLPTVALLAGGLATRLGALAADTPKCMIPVAGHPFLHHQLKLLKRHGVERVVICAGHLGDRIRAYAGDGSAWGLDVGYSFDGPRLAGTGGALRQALPLLSDPFFVLYGDNYLDVPMAPVAEAQARSGQPALMTVFRNEGRWAPSNVEMQGGRIVAYDKAQRTPAMRHLDYGIGVLAHAPLVQEAPDPFDLADFYGKLLRQGRLAAYEVTQRFYEVGSLAGLAETREHLGGA